LLKNVWKVILKLSAAARISTQEFNFKIIHLFSGTLWAKVLKKLQMCFCLPEAVSASSAAQIGEAFTKTASSARSTGMSMENLTAILATLIGDDTGKPV